MWDKLRKFKTLIIIITIIIPIFATALAYNIPAADAHILIIGDSLNDYPTAYSETKQISETLKSKGYNVLELYRSNATAKNILKGMYNADAIIYAGHGGYQSGNYDLKGGVANPPFALVGSDNKFIWGIGEQMREGWDSSLFYAPFKPNIPVILLHACFSTGWVGDYEVANPIETIYNFATMFTGSGANYYATAWNGAEIVYDFLNGAKNFAEANKQNWETIVNSTLYNGTLVWKNKGGYAAFVGDWNATFPHAFEVTPYDDQAAESWYKSSRVKNYPVASLILSSGPYYMNQNITFLEKSYDPNNLLIRYKWDLGDGTCLVFDTPQNFIHSYRSPGTYVVNHTVINEQNQIASQLKIVEVVNRSPVVDFKVQSTNFTIGNPINFISNSYELDDGDYITALKWNFGDGSTANGSSVTKTFTKGGNYTVTLTATDNFGKSSSKSVKLTINPISSPKPDLIVTSSRKSGSYLYVTIKNQGSTTAKNFYTRAWYGKNSYQNYKNMYTSSLSPGASKTFKVAYYYKNGTVKVDYFNKVSESNENNNIRTF